MKKQLLALAIALIGAISSAQAQCSVYPYIANNIYHRDTTLVTLAVDTSSLSGTYTWSFSGGGTHTGSIVNIPFADYVKRAYTVTGSFAGGCIATAHDSFVADYIFKCSRLYAPRWNAYSLYHTYLTQNITIPPDPSRVQIELLGGDSSGNAEYVSPLLQMHANINWGNGNTTSQSCGVYTSSTFPSMYGSDTFASPYSSKYRYGGEYNITGTVYYFLDTMTCPVTVIPKTTVTIVGPTAPPVINGGGDHCVEDTIRLTAMDTTGMHNMRYLVDTTGCTGGYTFSEWFDIMNDTLHYERHNFLEFTWTNPAGVVVGSDSALVINGLTLADTGTYHFTVWNRMTQTGTDVATRVTAGCTAAGIAATGSAKDMLVYPNPATDVFHLTLPASAAAVPLELTDISGRVVNHAELAAGTTDAVMPLSGIAPGNYLLKATVNGETFRTKVTVW